MVEKFTFKQNISEEIFEQKYNLYNQATVEDVMESVAEEVALAEETKEDVEKWKSVFYDELISTRLIPAGRILANARPFSTMKNYNNCFTIDVEDNMEGIYQSIYEDAMISRTGGGVGFDISKLRPKNSPLSKLQGAVSSGPMSFLRIFNESAKIIQTGGYRRSAHIALMDISHPDIEEFITAKRGDINKEFTQFNISVKIPDAFMKAVKDDADWDLEFEGTVYKTVKARHLYKLLSDNAFMHNEPGVFYSDTVEKYNNGWWAFKLDRVNPCGEIVMPPYSLCCLSAVNLSQFVRNPFEKEAAFDYKAYAETVRVGIRFLDNVLERTDYPLERIEEFSKEWRRIGLGITGLGDAFAMLGIKYGSKESKILAEAIAETHMVESYTTSVELAKEKGPFLACDKKKLSQSAFITNRLPESLQKKIAKVGLRNIALNTIAPTGTISFSIGQNCSSGVEPIFSLQYDRNIRTGRGDETRTETVYDYAWLKYIEHLGENHLEFNGDVPEFFNTTLNIDPYDAIDIQAIWQTYIDHSISKTLNLPKGTKKADYDKLFEYAYEKGLKGFTTFNPEGSMKGVLEYNEAKEEQVDEFGRPLTINRTNAPKRPKELQCDMHQIVVNKEKHLVLIGRLDDGSIYEVFVTPNTDNQIDIGTYKKGLLRKVKKGHYQLVVVNGEEKKIIEDIGKQFNELYGSLSRFISMGLRHGIDLQFVITQLQKDTSFASFEKAVARVLKKYLREGEKVKISEACPVCDSTNLFFKEGCMTCADCGWSKCS